VLLKVKGAKKAARWHLHLGTHYLRQWIQLRWYNKLITVLTCKFITSMKGIFFAASDCIWRSENLGIQEYACHVIIKHYTTDNLLLSLHIAQQGSSR
jgi:hypothetical protein